MGLEHTLRRGTLWITYHMVMWYQQADRVHSWGKGEMPQRIELSDAVFRVSLASIPNSSGAS